MPAPHFPDSPACVLVTGATGFIGRLLVQALLAQGHEVVALSRDPKRAAAILGSRVMCLGEMSGLAASHKVDCVINLAGARILGWRWSPRRRAELLQSRVGVTRELVQWIAGAHHKPRVLLSASAIGYYGTQAQGDDSPLAEDSPPQPVFMSELCQAWETEALKAKAFGVRVACLRFGLVLGHGGALPMMLLPVRLGLGGPLGSGRQWTSWIHVQDLLRAIAHVWTLASKPLSSGWPEAWNFTAPGAVTQAQFSGAAARVLHRPSFFPTPAWPLKLMLGEQAGLLVEGQRVQPKALLQNGFSFEHPELEGALKDLCQPA